MFVHGLISRWCLNSIDGCNNTDASLRLAQFYDLPWHACSETDLQVNIVVYWMPPTLYSRSGRRVAMGWKSDYHRSV